MCTSATVSVRLLAASLTVLGTVLFTSCNWLPRGAVQTAPVSGVVRLDGQPLENVKVLFVPIDRQSGGRLPAALAETDAQGRFALKNTDGSAGAAVGRNQVWLTTRHIDGNDADERDAEATDDAEPPRAEEISEERIPAKYNRATTLVFDVPPKGTRGANFDLVSDGETDDTGDQ